MGRVDDFRVELHAVEVAGIVGDDGEGSAFALRHDAEAFRQLGDAVAMAHPDLLAGALLPQPVEQRAGLLDVDEGAAVFAVVGAGDLAAQLGAHDMLAVADAEHGNALLEHLLGRAGRVLLGDERRAAGQDDRLGIELPDLLVRDGEGMEFAVDAALAQAPGDQLGYLGPEIQDENAIGCQGGGEGGSHVKLASSIEWGVLGMGCSSARAGPPTIAPAVRGRASHRRPPSRSRRRIRPASRRGGRRRAVRRTSATGCCEGPRRRRSSCRN